MRFIALLCLAILAPATLIADEASTQLPYVEIELDVSVTDERGVYTEWARIRTIVSGIFVVELAPYRLYAQLDQASDTDYSAEIRVYRESRLLNVEPIVLAGAFDDEVELTRTLGDATLELTATVSQTTMRVEGEYAGRPKSEAYFAIAALALMMIGVFLVISRGARKRGERF